VRETDRQRLGGAAFLTEFGACSESKECQAEIHRVLNSAEPVFHSWAYWQSKYFHDITTVSGPIESFYNEDGSLQRGKVQALSRTYAPTIAGRPLTSRFEPSTAAYRLTYAAEEATANLETVVFFNQDFNYQRDKVVDVTNGNIVSQKDNYLTVKAKQAGKDVSIAIIRKSNATAKGVMHFQGSESLLWQVSEGEGPHFSLSSHYVLHRFLQVVSDDGDVVCRLKAHEGREVGCDFSDVSRHQFLFSYRIEIWMDNLVGMERKIGTIPFKDVGPLLNKRIAFNYTWNGGEETSSTSSNDLEFLV